MITIALTGLKFAGKGTFADIAAKEYGFTVFRTRDQILADAAEYGITKPRAEISIAEMQHIGNAGRAKGGNGYWAERLRTSAVQQGVTKFIMDGVRHTDEIDALAWSAKEEGDLFVLIGVEAPTAVRFGRTKGRNDEGDAAMRDLHAFLAMDDADRGIGQPWNGQQVDACMGMAREVAAATAMMSSSTLASAQVRAYVFRNDSSLQEYQDAIRRALVECRSTQLISG